MKKIGIVRITNALLEDILKQHLGFPDDFKIRSVQVHTVADAFRRYNENNSEAIDIRGESCEFQEIIDNQLVPFYDVVVIDGKAKFTL